MDDAVTVMLVGLDLAMADELADDERFVVRSAEGIDRSTMRNTSTRSWWRWTFRGRWNCSAPCTPRLPTPPSSS